MNNFSDKEYAFLRSDTAEIRNSITKYIGYIITVTGFSGISKYIFDGEGELTNNLLLLSLSIVVTTFLFEIIWHKFKSHNRFVGYIQLLQHETDSIAKKVLKHDDISKKKYIKLYKFFLEKTKLEGKGVQDFFSWEFVMSRLHSTYFQKKDNKLKSILVESIENSRFVFSLSNRLYKRIDLDKHDSGFFESIIFPLYLDDNRKSFFKNPFKYFKYLYQTDCKLLLDDIKIDSRYIVNGWRYPKKITQIGFTSVSIIYFFFLYTFAKNLKSLEIYNIFLEFSFTWRNISSIVLLLGTTTVFSFWIYKYLRELKDLVYGRHSIDFYCWMFFIYRAQLLNSKDLIPVYFSRSFIRYFKSNMYKNVLLESRKNFVKSIKKRFSTTQIDNYLKDLTEFREFIDPLNKEIHDIVVNSFKLHESNNKNNNLVVSEEIFSQIISQKYSQKNSD